MIITIDGYAGTGKSTAALHLARELGFEFLNTGAMYRVVGVLLQRAGIDLGAAKPDLAAIESAVQGQSFDLHGEQLRFNGEDWSERIRSEEAGTAASKAGTFAPVRQYLQAEQRRLAEGRNLVSEGRDQGTSVFPGAAVKFFLHAGLEERTDRRYRQLQERGLPADRDEIRRIITARDEQDEKRDLDPLRAAPDAHWIDSSHLSLDEVVQLMKEIVQQCRSAS